MIKPPKNHKEQVELLVKLSSFFYFATNLSPTDYFLLLIV